MRHEVTVAVNGVSLTGWSAYNVGVDLLTPADAFTLVSGVPPSNAAARALWDTLAPDSEIVIEIDGTRVLTGYIGTRRVMDTGDGPTFEITGTDKSGRMVQESAPLVRYGDLTLGALAEQLAAPWFDAVRFSNATNRRLLRGRGKKARPGQEPIFNTSTRVAPRGVEPGATRWEVLEEIAAEAELLVWSTADGTALVIGRPNYRQEPQYTLHRCARESNVTSLEYGDSVADRFSMIVVTGAGRGDTLNYGTNVMRRVQFVVNGTGAQGVGRDFQRPKRLMVQAASRNAAHAKNQAQRLMDRHDATGRTCDVVVHDHGQWLAGRAGAPTIYAVDTVAQVQRDDIGLDEPMLITAVDFQGNRGAQTTTLRLVPLGTRLAP